MPFLFSEKGHKPFEYYRNYVQTYLEKDIAQIGSVQDLMRFENFMRLLAGRTGQLVNNSALSTEVGVSSTTWTFNMNEAKKAAFQNLNCNRKPVIPAKTKITQYMTKFN